MNTSNHTYLLLYDIIYLLLYWLLYIYFAPVSLVNFYILVIVMRNVSIFEVFPKNGFFRDRVCTKKLVFPKATLLYNFHPDATLCEQTMVRCHKRADHGQMPRYTRRSWSGARLYAQTMVRCHVIRADHGQVPGYTHRPWSDATLYAQTMVRCQVIRTDHGQMPRYSRRPWSGARLYAQIMVRCHVIRADHGQMPRYTRRSWSDAILCEQTMVRCHVMNHTILFYLFEDIFFLIQHVVY